MELPEPLGIKDDELGVPTHHTLGALQSDLGLILSLVNQAPVLASLVSLSPKIITTEKPRNPFKLFFVEVGSLEPWAGGWTF